LTLWLSMIAVVGVRVMDALHIALLRTGAVFVIHVITAPH